MHQIVENTPLYLFYNEYSNLFKDFHQNCEDFIDFVANLQHKEIESVKQQILTTMEKIKMVAGINFTINVKGKDIQYQLDNFTRGNVLLVNNIREIQDTLVLSYRN